MTQVARQVGTWWAVATTWAVRGVRRWVSQTIRRGLRPPGMRQVSWGSSASTVSTPHQDGPEPVALGGRGGGLPPR